MRKLRPIVLCLLALCAVIAPASAQDGPDVTRLCMVLNIGQVDDGTFNEVSYQGLLDIQRDYDLPEQDAIYLASISPRDWEQNIRQCIRNGYGIIITIGFQLGEITLQIAQEQPETYFIGVDQFVADGPENYVGIQFRDDEAGFLVGYMAGLMTESNIVGGIYGPEIPVIRRFRFGFENGALLAASDSDKSITLFGEYLPAFDIPDVGAASAAKWINRGADVIFGAAGLTGSGGITFAAQQGTYVIGVDQDEYFTTFGGGEEPGSDRIITSALKRVDVGVYDMASALLDGDLSRFPGGGNYILSIANGGISFANSHDADVDPAIVDAVIRIGGQLASGDLTTGVDPVTGNLAFDDPLALIDRYLAAFATANRDTLDALTCEAAMDEIDASLPMVQNATVRVESPACTFDESSSTVACEGTLMTMTGAEVTEMALGSYNVVQTDGNWQYCGVAN